MESHKYGSAVEEALASLPNPWSDSKVSYVGCISQDQIDNFGTSHNNEYFGSHKASYFALAYTHCHQRKMNHKVCGIEALDSGAGLSGSSK